MKIAAFFSGSAVAFFIMICVAIFGHPLPKKTEHPDLLKLALWESVETPAGYRVTRVWDGFIYERGGQSVWGGIGGWDTQAVEFSGKDQWRPEKR